MSPPRPVIELVAAANGGDRSAWEEIVARYLPLVVAIVNRFRLSARDAEDVSQTVWLRLVEHLGGLREPAALPRWIAQTAKHEALRLATAHGRVTPVDPLDGGGELDLASEAEDLDAAVLRDERMHVLRTALAELPAERRDLLLLLMADPPLTYAEIGARTGMPLGSIGPTRARYLRQLRETPTLRAFLTETVPGTGPLDRGGDHRDVSSVG